MKERTIRNTLLDRLTTWNRDPRTRIVEELVLCRGSARIDVAVVNGSLQGYEIKSADDTLERLAQQATIYNRVFDSVTLVIPDDHLADAKQHIPNWWGIMIARKAGKHTRLRIERRPQKNPDQDPLGTVELLWRDEALSALEDLSSARGVRSKSKRHIWQALVKCTTQTQLNEIVRLTLKRRQGWRVG